MEFDYDSEQAMLSQSVTRWLDANYRFEDFRRSAADAQASDANWVRMAELGLLSLNVAESDGGMGGGPIETLIVMQAFGRVLVVEPYVTSAVVAVSVLNSEPDSGRRTGLLTQIMQGACRIALAALEPEGRYDLAHIDTVARAIPGGYELTGKKAVVFDGGLADYLIVSARTTECAAVTEGVSLLLVDARTPGVQIRNFPCIDGKQVAEIEFKAARIPCSSVLGEINEGFSLLEWVVDRAIAALCAEAVGAMEALLDLTAEHLRVRRQFGQPIGNFQALQHLVADMAIALEQARSMALLAAATVGQADRSIRRPTLSAAKAVIGRSGRRVGELAVQLHGGMGMTDQLPVGHYFKRLIAINMSWGDIGHHEQLYGEFL